jgi:hypothetical protein
VKRRELTSSFVAVDSTSSANSNFMTHSKRNAIFGKFNLLRTNGLYTEPIFFLFPFRYFRLEKDIPEKHRFVRPERPISKSPTGVDYWTVLEVSVQ